MPEESPPGDIPAGPIYPPRLETQAAQALNVLMLMAQGSGRVGTVELDGLRDIVGAMADRLYPRAEGEIEVGAPLSVHGYHYVHPVKVAQLAMLLARLADGERAEVRDVGIAALLMNIGYVTLRGLPMDQQKTLEPDEVELVRQHATGSAGMLEGAGLSGDALATVAQHHERWDGSGYPAGLRGAEIHVYARILGIADTFVALQSRRPQRRSAPREAAMQYMQQQAGRLFDAELVAVLDAQVLQHLAHGDAADAAGRRSA